MARCDLRCSFSRASRLAVALWVLLPLLLAGAPARAEDDPRTRAKERIKSGDTHYKMARFQEALKDYEQALKLKSHPLIIFNIAQCHRQLGQMEKALFYYKLFLSEWQKVSPDKPFDFQEEVEDRIRTMTALVEKQKREARAAEERRRAKVAQIRLEGLVPGVRILVDGLPLATAPQEKPFDVAPGPRSIRVLREDFNPWEGVVQAIGGKVMQVRVPLQPHRTHKTLWLATGIVTTALAAGAFGVGIGYNIAANQTEVISSDFDTYRTISIVGYAAAGGMAAAALVSWLLYGRDLRKARRIESVLKGLPTP